MLHFILVFADYPSSDMHVELMLYAKSGNCLVMGKRSGNISEFLKSLLIRHPIYDPSVYLYVFLRHPDENLLLTTFLTMNSLGFSI